MIDEFCNTFREVPSDLVDESRGSIWHQIDEASLVASRAYWPSRFKADREVLLSALLAITMAAERMREPVAGPRHPR